MKQRFLKVFIVAALMFSFSFGLAACTKGTLESISVNEGTYQSLYNQHEEYSFANMKITAYYSSGKTEQYGASHFTISEFSTAIAGEQVVTITYKELTTTITITVIEAEVGEQAVLLSIAVVNGTYATSYNQNDSYSFAGMQIIATYDDETTTTLTYPSFSVGAFSTANPGVFNVILTYLTKTTTISITVIENLLMIGYETPGFLTTYFGNISVQANKESEFMVRNAGYTVGDDNAFVIMPRITMMNDLGATTIVTNKESDITVSQWIDGAFVVLSGQDLDAMVAIDNLAHTFDFTSAAVGHKFKLVLKPMMNDDVDSSLEDEQIALEVNVIDGYNAYNAADLSKFDNTQTAWDSYKAANNVSNQEINAIVLHRDIELFNSDFPSSFFHKVGDADVDAADLDYAYISANNGSLKDVIDVYKRTLTTNQTFTFVGNYFTIDASAISLITRDNGVKPTPGSFVIPNSALFDFTTHINNSVLATGVNASFKNINLIGNATRSAGENNIDRIGGLIMLDSWHSKTLLVDNIIAKSWLTTFRFTNAHVSALISNTRAYDSYSTSIYLWDVGNTTSIQTSEFKRSGGPLFMLTDAVTNDAGAQSSSLLVDTATVLENFVSGQEPWFTINGANSIVTNIVSLNALIQGYSSGFGMPKTFVNSNGLINFISVIVPADPLVDVGSVFGKFEQGTHATDMSDIDIQTLFGSVIGAGGAPIFQANGVEVFYDGETSLKKLTGTGVEDIGAGEAGLFMGNLISIFAKASAYLGVTVGYMDFVPAG